MNNIPNKNIVSIAKAVTSDPLIYMDGDYTPYYFCNYCDAEWHSYSANREDFKHSVNCPVLIAHDILTKCQRVSDYER